MKKYFIPMIIAGIVAGCGNKNSNAAESDDDRSRIVEAKQLYAPGDIFTPYSISEVPVMDVDIVTITLDNDGRARLVFRGDGASRIPTKKLRRMVALQALISSGVDRADITEEQLANFVALDDIGMTVQQWSENYRKPLAQLKSINSSGIMPQTDNSYSSSNHVANWLGAINVVLKTVEQGNAEQDYSLTPVPEQEDEDVEMMQEQIMMEELLEMEELEPEESDTEILLWNSNTMPERDNLPLGFNAVIVADKMCAYSHVDRLLGDVYRCTPFKLMTSQPLDSNEGGWCLSFSGAGDDWGISLGELNRYERFIDKDRALAMVVDNLRDSSGQPVNDQATGLRKFVARVWDGSQTVDQAQEFELKNCRLIENEDREGLPMILRQRNEPIINAVDRLRARLYNNEISTDEYCNLLKGLREEYRYSDTPHVLIKMAPDATYEAFVAVINEMYINEILNWRIITVDPRELPEYM